MLPDSRPTGLGLGLGGMYSGLRWLPLGTRLLDLLIILSEDEG